MKLILSPTKTMAFDAPETGIPKASPVFESQAADLNRQLSRLNRDQIQALYKTSDSLTQKTLEQIRGFDTAASGPALFVFRGEAFKTLDPMSFSREDLEFARDHLFILSGLYGILSPLDGIRPYRLDLNTPFKPGKKSLTIFWKEFVVPWAEGQLAAGEAILNLASEEYAALLRGSVLEDRLITLQFRQKDGQKLKNNSVRAKQARGLFAREVILNRIQDPEDLKSLSPEGYVFSQDHSGPADWFFIR
jgi:cytoplasmic iron level regulating protein YaaA (DUF328/UPF0246 family)